MFVGCGEKCRSMPLTRSQIMSRIRSKDSSTEIALRKALWRLGKRFRKNVKTVFGTPDLAVSSLKVAVFCDGEFWHGKKLLEGEVPKHNRRFWVDKLKRNIERDKIVNRELRKKGWAVIRFWEKDILKNPQKAARKVSMIIDGRKG